MAVVTVEGRLNATPGPALHRGAVSFIPETPFKQKVKSLRQRRTTRRHFLATAASAVGVAAAFPMTALAQQPVVLRMQSAWSAKDIFHEYALDFAKKINDMAGGRLRVDMLPAGAMLKPQDLLDAVHRGVIDGCHAVPAYWYGRNSAFSLFGSGPALGMDANGFLAWMRYGGGMDLYVDLMHRQLNLNVMPLLYGPMPAQPLGWFKKPVRSSADLKGMKLRADGLAADLFREMGAKMVAVPAQDTAAAMKRGELDAAGFSNASTVRGLGLPDGAQVCMLQSNHQPAEVFEVLINRRKFDALAPELRAIVRHAADAASADLSWKALHRYSADQAWLREQKKVQFHKTPPEVLRAQMQAWEKVIAQHSSNPFFERVWQSQLAWARRTVGWLRETAPDTAQAHDFWLTGKNARPAK